MTKSFNIYPKPILGHDTMHVIVGNDGNYIWGSRASDIPVDLSAHVVEFYEGTDLWKEDPYSTSDKIATIALSDYLKTENSIGDYWSTEVWIPSSGLVMTVILNDESDN